MKRHSPSPMTLAAAALILIGLAGGHARLSAEDAPTYLVILEEEEPQTTYPLLARTMSEQRLGELLFERFFFESLGGDMATRIFDEGWRAKPPNLTLVVSEGLNFSDGSPASFSDVAFTINEIYRQENLGHSVAAWYARVFGDAQQISPRAGSLRFLVSMPELGAERYLQTTYLLSRSALAGNSSARPNLEGSKRQPVGTGPFFAESVIENFDDIRLRRNPHRPLQVREGRMPIEHLRLLYDQDAARQRELMEGNRADVWVSPPAAVLPPFRNQRERYATRSYDLNQWWYVALNQENPHLALPAVREAIDLLLPRQQLLDKFGGEETAQLTSGPFLPGSAWAAADTQPTPTDAPHAAELLAGAGYGQEGGTWTSPSGAALSLRLGVQADILDDYNDVVYAMVDAWESAGVRIRVRGIRSGDWTTLLEAGKARGSYDMILGRWNVDREEASLELFRKSGSYGVQTNLFDWSSPKVEEILQSFYAETSGPVREALMQKLHRHLSTERPYLFMWTLQIQSLYRRDRISGFRPSSFYYYTDIGRVAWRQDGQE